VNYAASAIPAAVDSVARVRVAIVDAKSDESGVFTLTFHNQVDQMVVLPTAGIVEFEVTEGIASNGRMIYKTSAETGKALVQAFLSPHAFVKEWDVIATTAAAAKATAKGKAKAKAKAKAVPVPAATGASSAGAASSSSMAIVPYSGSDAADAAVPAPEAPGDKQRLGPKSFTKRGNGIAVIIEALERLVAGLAVHGVRPLDDKNQLTDCGFSSRGKAQPGPLRLLIDSQKKPVPAKLFYPEAAQIIHSENSDKVGNEYGEAVYKKFEDLCGNPRAWSIFARDVVRVVKIFNPAAGKKDTFLPI